MAVRLTHHTKRSYMRLVNLGIGQDFNQQMARYHMRCANVVRMRMLNYHPHYQFLIEDVEWHQRQTDMRLRLAGRACTVRPWGCLKEVDAATFRHLWVNGN